MPFRSRFAPLLLLISVAFFLSGIRASVVHAQTFKKLPPPGIEIDDKDHSDLTIRVNELDQKLRIAEAASADPQKWVPDVRVLIRAVDLALSQNLFYKKGQVKDAGTLLDEAGRRLQAAVAGKRGLELLGFDPAKADDRQLLVGGFVSRIDDSVQPYGIVLPTGFGNTAGVRYRTDVWLHGRGDTKTEIPFLTERMTKTGQYAPDNTIVLHPFGRHCNAFKFAGETDVYESIEHLKTLAAIDGRQISIRGFSMGGAGCWHLAVHDPTAWFAANPGAGFVDTIDYQGWVEKKPYPISPAREKIMRWYDVLPWVGNLKNTQTIGYSGEVDKQRKAAERAHAASKALGLEWPHVIGAKMGHKIDEPSKIIIENKLADWATAAAKAKSPRREIDFTTYTTRYSKADWIAVTGLAEQWKAGNVKASIDGQDRIKITTDGITHFSLDFSESGWKDGEEIDVILDRGLSTLSDQDPKKPGVQCHFIKDGDWAIDENPLGYRKRPGLQGPIDDAFCERFLFVIPSRPAAHGVVERWINRELRYAQSRWSRLMRGEVRVVKDRDLTPKQIADCNLICFGDFSSNRFLARVKAQLPIQWTREELKVGNKNFSPTTHAPVFCFPNPANPDRYLVVNSGMTYREFSNVSNSRQIAMLPDWAVLKVDVDDDSIFAGEPVAEGFFDENWKLDE